VNDRLQSLVSGAVLAVVIGWVLHIGKEVFVPITAIMAIVFSGFSGTRPIAVLLSRDGRL
jgi:hypothetical protein